MVKKLHIEELRTPVRCLRNRATKNEMDREWLGVKEGELVRRFEWVARPWTGCLWSVGLCPVHEAVILLVAPETSGELSDWLVKNDFAVCIYHRLNEVALRCSFWLMKNRAKLAGGSVLYMRWQGMGDILCYV